jgi:hypothetical protein
MRATHYALAALLVPAALAGADNARLMRKEADRLVALNSAVLKDHVRDGYCGQVRLQADVVRRDGALNVRIEHIEFAPSNVSLTAATPAQNAEPACDDTAPASRNERREFAEEDANENEALKGAAIAE